MVSTLHCNFRYETLVYRIANLKFELTYTLRIDVQLITCFLKAQLQEVLPHLFVVSSKHFGLSFQASSIYTYAQRCKWEVENTGSTYLHFLRDIL